jgi:hypothetical protein
MTHDELLAKIDKIEDYCGGAVDQVHGEFCISSDKCKCSEMGTAQEGIYKALRAVVEYHKPYESKNYGLLCRGCDEDPNYPCGTIRAIEKELV